MPTQANTFVKPKHWVAIASLVVVAVGMVLGMQRAGAHGTDCYAPYWGANPQDYQVGGANAYIFGVCAGVSAGGSHQEDGYHYVSHSRGYGSPYYYSQHNSNEYMQQSINGPSCSYTTSNVPCNYYDHWDWYIYYQVNPSPGYWKIERVNTCSGCDSWYRQGDSF